MTIGRAIVTMAVGLIAAPALASDQVAAQSPIDATVIGVLTLCPKLVRSDPLPSAEELRRMGFGAPTNASTNETVLAGLSDKGVLSLNYDVFHKRCTLNYAGLGYEHVAGVVRDVLVRNKLTRITGGDKGGAKADVFEGRVPQRTETARFIIIENYTNFSAAISYTERP